MSPPSDAHRLADGTPSTAGFTLLELLVVLVIASGLILLVPPLFARNVAEARAAAAASTFASDLRWLRHQAIRGQRETWLDLDLRDNRYTRSVDGTRRALPHDVHLRFRAPATAEPQAPAAIRFYPDGSSTGGAVDIIRGTRIHGVSVSWPFGRIEQHG